MTTSVFVIYEDNHLLIVEKPINMPVQKDQSNDLDLLTYLKNDLKIRYQKPGQVYLSLTHRLDRPVGGIMVFAKTSKAAARLSKQIHDNLWVKTYIAVIEGYLEPGLLEDYLLKNSKTNTTTVNPKGKLSQLIVKNSYQQHNLSLLEIELITGRSHQIRVQLSSRNAPIWGDQRYNPKAQVGQQIALFADGLTIEHPTTKEKLTFRLALPNRYPFNRFSLPQYQKSYP